MSKVIAHHPTERMVDREEDVAPLALRAGTGSELATLEPIQANVLQLVSAHHEPLTRGQIARRLGLAPEEVRSATQALFELRLLRRLNTIVESYVAATVAKS